MTPSLSRAAVVSSATAALDISGFVPYAADVDSIPEEGSNMEVTIERLIALAQEAIFERDKLKEQKALAKQVLEDQARDIRQYIEGVRRKAERQIEAQNAVLIGINDRIREIQEEEHAAQERVVDAQERVSAYIALQYQRSAESLRKEW